MAKAVSNQKVTSNKKKVGVFSSLKNTSFGESRFYVFEYGLQLVLVVGILSIITAMFNRFFGASDGGFFVGFLSGDVDSLLISAFTVLFPLAVILIQRTAESESQNPGVKNLPWRKGLLGVFLAVVSVWAVVQSVMFINSILSYLSTGFIAQTTFDWQQATQYLFAAFVLLASAWAYGNDYRYLARDHFLRLRHEYRYGLVIVSLVVAVLFLVFPFRESRQVMIDRMVVGDLSEIQAKIDDFVGANRYLPESLSDLDLSDNLKQRANAYVYTYERQGDSVYQLCADFSTSSETAKQPEFSSLMYETTIAQPASVSDWSHSAGRDCFSLNSVSGGDTSSTSPTSLENPAVETENAETPAATDVQGVQTIVEPLVPAKTQEVTSTPAEDTVVPEAQ